MPTNGGGGSSFKKFTWGNNKGPIKTIFMGDMMADTVLFHAMGESSPKRESGGCGKPPNPPDPKSEVVIKRKTNPQIMKRTTNFFLEIFIPKTLLDFKPEKRHPCFSFPTGSCIVPDSARGNRD